MIKFCKGTFVEQKGKNKVCGDGTGIIMNINQKSSLNQHKKKLDIQLQ